MKSASLHAQGQILKDVFGRNVLGSDDWCKRAARVLGVSRGRVYELASGRARFRRRHLVIIETFARNRRRAASTEIALAVRKAEETVHADLGRVAVGATVAKAMLADIARNHFGVR